MRIVPAFLFISFLGLLPFSAIASPAAEATGERITRSVYVYDRDTSLTTVEMRSIARGSAMLSAFSPFTNEEGAVRLNINQRGQVILTEIIGRKTYHASQFIEYAAEVSLSSPAAAGNPKSIRVVINYPKENPSVREAQQPAERAVIAAIRKSGFSSGLARLAKISYGGLGRFSAVVEIADESR